MKIPLRLFIFFLSGFFLSGLFSAASLSAQTTDFIRGDCDGDGYLTIADSIFMANIGFVGGIQPPCRAACNNVDGSTGIGLVDLLGLANFLFIPQSPPPPAPYPDCGRDSFVTQLPCDFYDCTPSVLPAPDPAYVLSLSSAVAVSGEEVEISTFLSNPQGEDVSGIAFGVCADPSGVVDVPCVGGIPNDCIDNAWIVQGSDLRATNNGFGAAFFAPAANADGWTVGLMVNILLDDTLPPGEDAEIVVTRYRTLGAAGTNVDLSFCQIGDPEVFVVVALLDGQLVVPETLGGTISIVAGSTFIRGDTNANSVFNALLDALFLLEAGFIPGSPQPPCNDAADADGGGSINALADGLAILNVGFVAGAPPLPPPFPECGPGAEVLGCDSPLTCP